MDLPNFLQPILQNQVVTGLSYTAILGMIGYQLRSIPHTIKELIERGIIVKLSVTNNDTAFTWLELWLASQPYSKRSRTVLLKSYDSSGNLAVRPQIFDEGENSRRWELSPGGGIHWFMWRGRIIWLDRNIGDIPAPNGITRSQPRLETIIISTIGRSQDILREIVMDAYLAISKKETIPLYLWRNSWWSSIQGKSPRSLDTIVLRHGQISRIVSDITYFISNKEYYVKRGIPWRRGYLFAGLPGTGKTSFVLALSSFFNRPVHILNLGSVDDDDELFSAIIGASPNAIILIEDIDCAESSRERTVKTIEGEEAKKEAKGITKAGLLNALDGLTTPDGRILIMTTNHPDKLDPALIRPGRADIHESFEFLDPPEQIQMSKIFYGHSEFMAPGFAIAPAELQKAFMLFPNDPDKATKYLLEDYDNRNSKFTSEAA